MNRDETGISHVVGSVLLLAIVLLLVIVLASLVPLEEPGEPTPNARFTVEYDDGERIIKHTAGDTVDGEKLYVVVGDSRDRWSDMQGGDETVSAGDRVTYAETVSEQQQVRLVYLGDDDRSAIVHTLVLRPRVGAAVTFCQSNTTVLGTPTDPVSVYATDVTGTSEVDVLSASLGGRVDLYEQQSDGTFTTEQIVSGGAGPRSVHASDLTGSAAVDVVVGMTSAGSIELYEQNAGSFTPTTVTTSAEDVKAVTTTDVDGDGNVDIVAALGDAAAGKIELYKQDGSGNFPSDTTVGSLPNAFSVDTAEVTGDGRVDIVGVSNNNGGEPSVVLYEQGPSGGFDRTNISKTDDGAIHVDLADVTGNSRTDIVVAAKDDSRVVVYENQGSGSFVTHRELAMDRPESVYATDYTGNGKTDIVVTSKENSTVMMFQQQDDGSFDREVYSDNTDSEGAFHVYSTEITGDGKLDVVAAELGEDTVRLWTGKSACNS
jgi:hypothetical protein